MGLKPRDLLASALISLALAAPAWADSDERRIAVTGEGRVEAVPDMASVTLGVTNEAEEAGDAMQATSDAVWRILDRLTEMGLESRDVQTSRFALSPVWSRRTESDSDRPRITGFTASNMVMVRVRDLDKLGALLDAVVSDGANDFNGLSFGVQESDALQDEALAAAVADATKKARLLTDAAGVTLGPVVSITEQGSGAPRPMMMEMAAARDSGAPVAAGEVTLSASVSMVFAIED